jgi:hypothetical protein
MLTRNPSPRTGDPWRALALIGALAAAALLSASAPAGAGDPKPRPQPQPKKQKAEKAPLAPPGFDGQDLQDLLKDLPPGLDEMLKNLPLQLEDLFKNLPQGLDPQQAEEMRKQMQQAREAMRKAFQDMLKQGGGQFEFRFGGPFGPGQNPFRGRFDRAPASRLGVRVEPPGEALADQLGLRQGEGLVLGQVRDGSPAAKAGLKPNDILLQLGGKRVPSDPARFRELVKDLKANTPLEAQILRKGKQETIKGLTLPPGDDAAPGKKPRRPRGADVIRLAPQAVPTPPALLSPSPARVLLTRPTRLV